MRLLVSTIPFDGGKSGISVYAREVVHALRSLGHDVSVLAEPGEAGDFHAPRWTRRPVLSMAWHLAFLPFWLWLRRSRFDGFVICAANRRVCAFYPLPTVATVHDLANFHVPGKYSRLRMFYLARVLPHFAKKAHRLVAVSGATKADMVRHWHCPAERVTVLYNGLPPHPPSLLPARCEAGGTLLYISRIEHPGKNHVRLIEAYSRLPHALAEAHPLVIAGADWKDAAAVHAAAARSPHSGLIRFTGFVPAADMERLWAEAGYYVFPSLFEGFGLSLAEAMSRGVPAACSANGSLGEIGEGVAMTFDPESVDSIAAALERLLTEGAASREERIARGLARAKSFSWADHARGLACLVASAREEARDVVSLFGIPVARLTEAEAVERVVALAKSPRKGRAAMVATLNVDFVSNAVSAWPFGGDGELWGYLRGADLVTADGMPLVALSRLMRRPLPERVTGADMVPAICRRLAEEGLSVYVLGGERETLEAAFARLAPVRVAGLDPAIVRLGEDQGELVSRINAARPDLLFVALGNPKQELWMGRNAARLEVPVMMGVGGSFNFIAGRVRRAPRWMQRAGLEWVWRLIEEPRRLWRRYAYGLVKFSCLALRQLAGGFDG